MIDKFCWKKEANFDYLLAHVSDGKPISYFDSSSLNPSSTMIGSTCDIWIDVLDQIMEQCNITIRTKINMLRNDSKYLMCGACVPYATGIGRISQGIVYLRYCENINSVDDTIKCKTRNEYANIYRMTDLGVLMPYHNIGIHVEQFRKNINMFNNHIKNIVCNGKLYEFDKQEGLFVDYTGGHMFSQYIGRIDISNSFLVDRPNDLYEIYNMGYDDRKLCHTVFIKIIQKKIFELQHLYEQVSSHIIKGWIEYILFELNERCQVVDFLWKSTDW